MKYVQTIIIEQMGKSIESIAANLQEYVKIIAGEIGERSYHNLHALRMTLNYAEKKLKGFGYITNIQEYIANGHTYENLWVEKRGSSNRYLIIGAHYDTVTGTPGADDNASGVAGLLEIARLIFDVETELNVLLVLFPLEEPPFFRTKFMGSYVFAKKCHNEHIKVEGMICLESIGYFTDEPETQMFPLPFFRYKYPTTGNFIAFVSDIKSKPFLIKIKSLFKESSILPVESISTLSIIPGVDFSDHRSFWKFGYKAFMVTDTAFYRNPNYHSLSDTPETLDYHRMALLVKGLSETIERYRL